MLHLCFAVRRKRMWLSLMVAGAFFSALALTDTLPGIANASRSAADRQDAAPAIVTPSPGAAYRQMNMVSDVPGLAFIEDPRLVNPWGITAFRTSPLWVVNAGTSLTTTYSYGGLLEIFVDTRQTMVTIPGGLPTGVIYNTSSEFSIPGGNQNRHISLIFASLTGNIMAAERFTNDMYSIPGLPNNASIVASHPGHAYTGLALSSVGTGAFLYAADFANGRIDVFNGSYQLQPTASFPFADETIPTMPGNRYHPYNIQAIGGSLYVTYAKVGANGMDEEGAGNGFVRRFSPSGLRDTTFGIDNGSLNSPWGIVVAPARFGVFSGKLLVGNSGRGNPSIHAFDVATGTYSGTLQDESGHGIIIDKLRALSFGAAGGWDTIYFTAGIARGEHGLLGLLKATTVSATSLVEFGAADYTIGEGNSSIQITVTRAGNVSDAASVNYATFDESTASHASQKSDYEIAVGTLTFAPGETSKTFRVLLVDDKFDENDEVINVALSNPTGAGLGLGSVNRTVLTITDNDTGVSATNPIDDTAFFVRQHYLDFLGREPDAGGFNAWVNVIANCAVGNPACDRITVSRSFFESPEYQSRGYFIIRTYIAAYGRNPLYGEFIGDLGRLNGATPEESNALRADFTRSFTMSREFVTTFTSGLPAASFVDQLIANTGVAFANRDALVAALDANTKTRAQVLQEIVDSPQFFFNAPTFSRAYVLSQYFGYLRRNPDTAGYNMWINYLMANPGDFRTMVNGFVNSVEYRQRFGPVT